MTDSSTYEELIKLVDQVQISTSEQLGAFFTSKAWKLELKHRPERFYRNDDGDLMWLGAKVVVIGDDKRFWALADKIVKKENTNEH